MFKLKEAQAFVLKHKNITLGEERERDSENNGMMDWETNAGHYGLFQQWAAVNKVFLISLLWWLTSFSTLKNHSWNSKMNWFFPTIINYSTSHCRRLCISSTLHLQNSGLVVLPFSPFYVGAAIAGVSGWWSSCSQPSLYQASNADLPYHISASGEGKQLVLSFK